VQRLKQYCPKCKRDLPKTAYSPKRWGRRGWKCRECATTERRKWYAKNLEKGRETCRRCESKDPRFRLLRHARERAKKYGVPLDINREDIVIPVVCPALGIPLSRGVGGHKDGSPSLDRIIPAKGYVKGNIAVLSHRANRLKQDAALEELEALVRWFGAAIAKLETTA